MKIFPRRVSSNSSILARDEGITVRDEKGKRERDFCLPIRSPTLARHTAPSRLVIVRRRYVSLRRFDNGAPRCLSRRAAIDLPSSSFLSLSPRRLFNRASSLHPARNGTALSEGAGISCIEGERRDQARPSA